MVDPMWMDGEVIVRYPVGVRVYDLGYCTARCGYDKPAPCPDSAACRRYEVYVVRWKLGGDFEWRQILGIYTKDDALEMAERRAESEQAWADRDPVLQTYISIAAAEGLLP